MAGGESSTGELHASDVAKSLVPGERAHRSPQLASLEIAVLEVDPAVTAREAGLVGRRRESLPGERHRHRGNAGFDTEVSLRDGDRCSEEISAGEALEDFGGGCAERAVPGHVLREGRRREPFRL